MAQPSNQYYKDNLDKMIEDIRLLVETESPSRSIGLLNKCADQIEKLILERIGEKPEEIFLPGGKRILKYMFGLGIAGKPALVLCHYDTVHQEGTIKTFPFSRGEGILRGPGSFDMKVGLVQGIWALKHAINEGRLRRPVILLITPDEEIGSTDSRNFITDCAKDAEYTIVLEASAEGRIKTGRKGTGRFSIKVKGRAVHAGLEPEKGINAISEMAPIILHLQDLNKNESGTTVNVGTIKGGTTSNVVPAEAEITIDIRVWSQEEADRISSVVHALKPDNPEATIEVEGGFDRPPMRPTEKTEELVSRIKKLGEEMGLDIQTTSVGGASDGNLVAPLGIPVLDGFGAVGGGAHSINEFVEEKEISLRAELLERVLENL